MVSGPRAKACGLRFAHFRAAIPPALWDDLERWAQDELRSVNGQIEMILRQAVAKRKGSSAARREKTAD